MPYTKAFWLGEDGLLGVFGFFPPDFSSPWASSSHGSSTTVGSYMGGNRNPMKAAWGLLSIHPAPLPCDAMPGVAGPLPAPGRLPCVSVGEPRGLAGSSVELLRMEKSPGSALSLRRHLSWEVFFFPSSQHGCLEISYAGSGCDVFITQRTVWQSPEKPFTN